MFSALSPGRRRGGYHIEFINNFKGRRVRDGQASRCRDSRERVYLVRVIDLFILREKESRNEWAPECHMMPTLQRSSRAGARVQALFDKTP